MKFIITVKNKNSQWEDTYDQNVEDPHQWAKDTVARFNDTLRPHELPRELVSVNVVSEVNDHHKWEKRTNGQIVLFRGRIADLMYCADCGITGKRFGLGSHVVRDSKFKAKKFEKCKKEMNWWEK